MWWKIARGNFPLILFTPHIFAQASCSSVSEYSTREKCEKQEQWRDFHRGAIEMNSQWDTLHCSRCRELCNNAPYVETQRKFHPTTRRNFTFQQRTTCWADVDVGCVDRGVWACLSINFWCDFQSTLVSSSFEQGNFPTHIAHIVHCRSANTPQLNMRWNLIKFRYVRGWDDERE